MFETLYRLIIAPMSVINVCTYDVTLSSCNYTQHTR